MGPESTQGRGLTDCDYSAGPGVDILRSVEWVLLMMVDDRNVAQSQVDYLRERNVLGRVVEGYSMYCVEVRRADKKRARRLWRARVSLRKGRIPVERSWRSSAARIATVALVASVLVLAVAPVILIFWIYGRAGLIAVPFVFSIQGMIWVVLRRRYYRMMAVARGRKETGYRLDATGGFPEL